MKSSIFFCFIILLSGCAPTKELGRRQPDRPAQEVINTVNAHGETIVTFQARGSISVESPSFANSGSFELWIKKPDSVRVDIQGPFGIRVASALFAHNHYMFYNSFKNEVTEGNFDAENLPAFMSIQIRPEDVVSTFCGTRSFLRNETSPDSFDVDNESYLLQFHHRDETTRYRVDDRTFYITEIEHLDATGSVWSEEQYDFDRDDAGVVVPQSIRLIHNTLQSSVSLVYESVHVNGPISGINLDIPPDARRVRKE